MKTIFVLISLLGGLALFAADTQSPKAPTDPKSPNDPKFVSPSPTPTMTENQNSGGVIGTWKVSRAIYDYITVLKDITENGKDFYAQITLLKSGKGKILYNQGQEEIDIEWEMREQGITIAYGSRLKPQTDLFQYLILNDGSLFLKSRKLGNANGSVIYILKKI